MKSKYVSYVWSGLLGGLLPPLFGITLLDWRFYVLILIPILGSNIEREKNTYFWFVLHPTLVLLLTDSSPLDIKWWIIVMIPLIGVVIERGLNKKENGRQNF